MRLLGGDRGGDTDQLEQWLADGYDRSYRTAFLILHNRQDAEEAVQEAFLRAWRFRDAVPTGPGVQPWMYRVVVNACLSKLRAERNGRQRTGPLDPDRAEPPAPDGSHRSTGPEETAELSEMQRTVVSALAALPEHLRAVVVLRYYVGLSEREIAEVIRRRPGTVKSRIHEAKLLLGRDPQLSPYQAREMEGNAR